MKQKKTLQDTRAGIVDLLINYLGNVSTEGYYSSDTVLFAMVWLECYKKSKLEVTTQTSELIQATNMQRAKVQNSINRLQDYGGYLRAYEMPVSRLFKFELWRKKVSSTAVSSECLDLLIYFLEFAQREQISKEQTALFLELWRLCVVEGTAVVKATDRELIENTGVSVEGLEQAKKEFVKLGAFVSHSVDEGATEYTLLKGNPEPVNSLTKVDECKGWYIDRLREFQEVKNDLRLKPSHIAFYMEIWTRAYFQGSSRIEITNKELSAGIGVSEPTLIKVKAELKNKAEFIAFYEPINNLQSYEIKEVKK